MTDEERFKWFLIGFMNSGEGHNAEYPFSYSAVDVAVEKRDTFEMYVGGGDHHDIKANIEAALSEVAEGSEPRESGVD